MNRKIMAMLFFSTVFLTLTGCASPWAEGSGETKETVSVTESAGQSTAHQEAVKEIDAKSYVEVLCSGDVSELTEKYTCSEALLTAMEAQGGFEGLQASLLKQLGELKSAGEPQVSAVGGYTSYSVPCQFASGQNLNLVINVDGDGQIAGIVTAAYDEGSDSQTEMPAGISEEELNLQVSGHDDWELSGMLTLPEGEGPFPAVVLVHGSGPSDMDETIGPNKLFRDLAWELAGRGVAVYRYDKRTYSYGAEIAGDTSFTLQEETVEDAVQAVQLLRAQSAVDAEHIYVLGHSLGGQALPRINDLISSDSEPAAGYIFLAAPARNLRELMQEQYDFLYSQIPSLTEEQAAEKVQIYEGLDKLQDIDALGDEEFVLGACKAYWQDLENYDPVLMAENIQGTCLVLQGEEDYQVTMEDFDIWKNAFGTDNNWTFKSYAGLTHLFMPGEKANGSADYSKAQNADAEVIEDIVEFTGENGGI